MDRKKIAIIFLVVVGVLFVLSAGVGVTRNDESSEDADQDYEAPWYMQALGSVFGGGDPLRPSELTVTSGDAEITADRIVLRSSPVVIRVAAAEAPADADEDEDEEQVRSVRLTLDPGPPPPASDRGDGDEAETPPPLVLDVAFIPNEEMDREAEPVRLGPDDEADVRITTTETGGTITFTIVSGDPPATLLMEE